MRRICIWQQDEWPFFIWDGFDGKLNSSKWAKITKCSSDTALRDIQDLISKGILQKSDEGGRVPLMSWWRDYIRFIF